MFAVQSRKRPPGSRCFDPVIRGVYQKKTIQGRRQRACTKKQSCESKEGEMKRAVAEDAPKNLIVCTPQQMSRGKVLGFEGLLSRSLSARRCSGRERLLLLDKE